MLANGMHEAAQQMLDLNPSLQYKIELRGDTYELVDMVTGAALWLKKFITQDADCLAMKQDAMKASKQPYEVLIHGETGTGKEIIARSMIGDREGLFLSVNCAGLPENLIESELFGHLAGSFTGATGQRQGMMAAAKGGVFFLDEVSELPLAVQGKLLRAIQEKRVRMIGDKEEKEITCRFVFATNKSLPEMVKNGTFKVDLYARISTLELFIKPLHERLVDVPLIITDLGERLGIPQTAREFLDKYWGNPAVAPLDLSFNVRSLERALKRLHTWGHL
jgi:transcriptional regulator with PAS, ATPase and Fis domain